MWKWTLAPALYRSLLNMNFISNGMAKTSVRNMSPRGVPRGRLSMVLLESALCTEDLTDRPYTFLECSLLGSSVFLPTRGPGWWLRGPVPALCTDNPWRAGWLFALSNDAGVNSHCHPSDGTLQSCSSSVWALMGGWRNGFIYSTALWTTCSLRWAFVPSSPRTKDPSPNVSYTWFKADMWKKSPLSSKCFMEGPLSLFHEKQAKSRWLFYNHVMQMLTSKIIFMNAF